MKYAVEQKYFIDGHVKQKIIQVPDNSEPLYKEHNNGCYYLDVFNNKEDAIAFMNHRPWEEA